MAPMAPEETPAAEIRDVEPTPGSSQAPPTAPPPVVEGAAALDLGVGAPGGGSIIAPPVEEAPPGAQPAPAPAAIPQPPAPPAPAVTTPPPPETPAALPAPPAAPAQGQEMPQEWPCRGYSGPQPWQATNTPELTQNERMVSGGSAGPEVVRLAALLAAIGYSTSIAEGRNPHAIYDFADVVAAFCTDYGVQEDPAVISARTADTVGPWIWEALTRATQKRDAA